MFMVAMLCIWVLALAYGTSAIPLATNQISSLSNNKARSPVSASAFAAADDWPTNVVFTGGSQSYGLWVPPDGKWYDFENIQCLGTPAYAIGDCNDITIDQIGVVAGNGPCTFATSTGSYITVAGNPGDGFTTVGPPQRMLGAACG